MSTAARETSKLQIGTVRPILPEQLDAACKFARAVAERDGWDAGEVLAMIGAAS